MNMYGTGHAPHMIGGNGHALSALGEHAASSAKVLVIGCSAQARVVLDILEQNPEYQVVGLLDSYRGATEEVLGYRVLGSDEDLPAMVDAGICDSVLVAIGDNWVRGRVVERIKRLIPAVRFVSAIHPFSQISKNVVIGEGTVIMPGVVVNTGCRIGEFCILNTSSSLDHDSVMESFSSLAPRAVTGGTVTIGTYTAVAIGAVISHSIRIGKHTVIGAGATVVRDIPEGVVAYGTPAKVIRKRNPQDPYLGDRGRSVSTQGLPMAPGLLDSLKSLRLIPSGDPEWNTYLSRVPHDFFHRAEFHQVTENCACGKAWLAVFGNCDKFVAWPYLLQEIVGCERQAPDNLRDVTSIYGYTGPLALGCDSDEAFLLSAWHAMLDAWAFQCVVSVFTRFHPVLANHHWVPYLRNDESSGKCVRESLAEGKTVGIDLQRLPEEIWDGYKRQLRQALRRLFGLDICVTIDPEWRDLDQFVRIYYSTMKRNRAGSSYLFPGQYFRELKEALGEHGCLVVARSGDEMVSAALLIEYARIVTVHLLATDPRFVELSPSKLVLHEAQAWARARGNRVLHMGGGRGSRTDDSLFRFKCLFSNSAYPFYTGRWILNREAYDTLASERRTHAERLRFTVAKGYFPAYRAPLCRPGVDNSNSAQADLPLGSSEWQELQ